MNRRLLLCAAAASLGLCEGCSLIDLDGLTRNAAADKLGTAPAAPPIAFVQATSWDSPTAAATASAALVDPQASGNLNVVVVGWGDTTHRITSVSDSNGNLYVLAAGPTTNTNVSQSIYFAARISGGANAVFVAFDGAVNYPCVVVAEYAGLGRLDQTSIGIGMGNSAFTNPATTGAAQELLFGAGTPDDSAPPVFGSAGSGYQQRVITSVTGTLAEDRVSTDVGTYQATGNLTASTPWVMQLVTFEP